MKQDVNVLSIATLSAGRSVKDGTNNNAELEQWITTVSAINNPLLEDVKREATMALKAAIRYQKSQRPLEAKLVRKHIDKVADEFARLARLVERKEGAKNGV